MTAAAQKQSRLQAFVNKRIYELQGRKSQTEIATEAGFVNANFISMLKSGRSKLALDRVPSMAKALDCDPAHLFRLALEQFMTKQELDALGPVLKSVVSENEAQILDTIREAANGSDPYPNAEIKDGLNKLFA